MGLRRAFKALLMTFGLSGCSGLDLLNAVVPGSGYVADTDLPYGDGPRRRLDIYRPAAAPAAPTGAPVIVFFYGGNWESGARRLYRFVGQGFASQGFVTVVPDYRLYPEVRYPGFVEDGAAAVVWVVRNIVRFGGDPRRIVLVGHSAGAHIALMLALNPAFLGTDRAAVAGAAGLAGPYDFNPSGRNRDILNADSGGPSSMPIDYVDGAGPPVLLLTGAADATFSPGNSTRLAARIRERGGPVRVIEYQGVGHEKILAALAAPLTWLLPVRQDVAAFANDPK
jgi:acetyl esterase/lipase